METKFKDVAHLYLGCEVEVKRKNDKIPIVGRMCEITKNSNHGDWVEVRFEHLETVTNRIWETSASNFHTFFFNEDDVKPLLRKLESMTEAEAIDLYTIERDRLLHTATNDHDIRRTPTGIQVIRLDLLDNYLHIGHEGQIYKSIQEMNKKPVFDVVNNWPEIFTYLLSKHFDLFNLIDSGEAIDLSVK